jgi:hypothetical protein
MPPEGSDLIFDHRHNAASRAARQVRAFSALFSILWARQGEACTSEAYLCDQRVTARRVARTWMRGVSAGGIRPPYLQKPVGAELTVLSGWVIGLPIRAWPGSPATSAGLTGPAGVNPAALAEGVSTCWR